jgi:hypothetical protein
MNWVGFDTSKMDSKVFSLNLSDLFLSEFWSFNLCIVLQSQIRRGFDLLFRWGYSSASCCLALCFIVFNLIGLII